jgi:hypothetical protein
MKEIYFFSTLKSWLEDKADTSIRGMVISKDKNYIEIQDENGYTQLINISMLYAIVY